MISSVRQDTAPGVISFFSGAGILDLGFENAGYTTFLASELHMPFARAYLGARQQMGAPAPVRGFVYGTFDFFLCDSWQRQLLAATMEEAREATGCVGFIGGPPCPDFSISGSGAGEHGESGRLLGAYVRLIIEMKPDFFVLENVKGLWSTGRNRVFFERVRADLAVAGYAVTANLVNSIRYGVPQDRQRVLAVGFSKDNFGIDQASLMARAFHWHTDPRVQDPMNLKWPTTDPYEEDSDLPLPDHFGEEQERLTIEWWFKNNRVEQHPNGVDYFRARKGLRRFTSIAEGDTDSRSFKRPHRHRYSPTCAYGNNEVHLHPYKPRRLSVAEAMAIQTIPESFVLAGLNLSEMFKTIGNAVPYLLGLDIARSVLAALKIMDHLPADPARDQLQAKPSPLRKETAVFALASVPDLRPLPGIIAARKTQPNRFQITGSA
jgi:DNA (cytosine-5)-methyltransferase 1